MITFQSVVPLYEEKIIINHTHSCEHARISPRCGKAKDSPHSPTAFPSHLTNYSITNPSDQPCESNSLEQNMMNGT